MWWFERIRQFDLAAHAVVSMSSHSRVLTSASMAQDATKTVVAAKSHEE